MGREKLGGQDGQKVKPQDKHQDGHQSKHQDKTIDLLQGTLDLLILKAVSLGPLHGYGVLLRIQQISGEELVIQQGSLYPALYRLEHQGTITSEWGESENNRKAKYYSLTAVGRERLEQETEKWDRMAGIIGTILSAT
jgi:transcriptional regulator